MIGVDIIEVETIQRSIKKLGDSYLNQVFTKAERKRSNNPILGKGKRSLNQAVVCSQFQGSKLS